VPRGEVVGLAEQVGVGVGGALRLLDVGVGIFDGASVGLAGEELLGERGEGVTHLGPPRVWAGRRALCRWWCRARRPAPAVRCAARRCCGVRRRGPCLWTRRWTRGSSWARGPRG